MKFTVPFVFVSLILFLNKAFFNKTFCLVTQQKHCAVCLQFDCKLIAPVFFCQNNLLFFKGVTTQIPFAVDKAFDNVGGYAQFFPHKKHTYILVAELFVCCIKAFGDDIWLLQLVITPQMFTDVVLIKPRDSSRVTPVQYDNFFLSILSC